MEDRAKYVLVGLFTFAVIIGGFAFVYWLHATSANKESAIYRVIFSGSVAGLRIGAPVLFNGIRVGEVTDLRLTNDPSEVAAVLAVAPGTPVRADTQVTLDYAGLTGIAAVSLRGLLASAAPLKSIDGELPTLRAQTATGDMSSAARETLAHVDAVITQNQEALHKSIKNIEAFTESLARNSQNIDQLMKVSIDTVNSVKTLSDNLNKRTAEITKGVLQVTDSAHKHIEIVGADAHRAINNIDAAVSDLAKHPSRILFGGQ